MSIPVSCVPILVLLKFPNKPSHDATTKLSSQIPNTKSYLQCLKCCPPPLKAYSNKNRVHFNQKSRFYFYIQFFGVN